MKDKLDFKILNYFLQDQEPYYLPNFLYSKNKLKKTIIRKKKIRAKQNSIHSNKNKDNLNINIINNNALISSYCNTQNQKTNNLTPFQKITQSNDNFSKFNFRRIKPYINKEKNKLISRPNTDRNFYSKRYDNHSSPKDYINKIRLYKINNNRYNNIRTDLYYFYLHRNQIKFNNIDIDHLTIENKEKNLTNKKGNSSAKIKIDEENTTNLDKK
jgi:hypothetical protein